MARIFVVPDHELSLGEKTRNVLAAYAFSILWLLVVLLVLKIGGFIALSEKLNILYVVFNQMLKGLVANKYSYLYVLHVCLLAPVLEELIFREFPLRWVLSSPKVEHERRGALLSTIFFTSVIFGFMHGSVLNVFLQGVAGLALSWVYLVNRRSYVSAVIVHALYNSTLVVVSLTQTSHVTMLLRTN